MTTRRSELERALDGVEGYFSTDEAWALYCAVLRSASSSPPRVVEIGSYKGRSTIAIAFALADRGNGSVVSIDPHAPTGRESYVAEHGRDDTYDAYVENVRRAGVERFVVPVRTTSAAARPGYDGVPIDVLFVDGSHDYEDVLADVDAWLPLVADRAILAFNDPYAPGVNRALRERLFSHAFAIRSPWHVNNTLFLRFERGGRTDPFTTVRLRGYLFVERLRIRLLKLLLKGLLEHLGVIYVAPKEFKTATFVRA